MRYYMCPLSARAKEEAARIYSPPTKGHRVIKEDYYEFLSEDIGRNYFPDLDPPIQASEFKEIQLMEKAEDDA